MRHFIAENKFIKIQLKQCPFGHSQQPLSTHSATAPGNHPSAENRLDTPMDRGKGNLLWSSAQLPPATQATRESPFKLHSCSGSTIARRAWPRNNKISGYLVYCSCTGSGTKMLRWKRVYDLTETIELYAQNETTKTQRPLEMHQRYIRSGLPDSHPPRPGKMHWNYPILWWNIKPQMLALYLTIQTHSCLSRTCATATASEWQRTLQRSD